MEQLRSNVHFRFKPGQQFLLFPTQSVQIVPVGVYRLNVHKTDIDHLIIYCNIKLECKLKKLSHRSELYKGYEFNKCILR